MYTICNVIIKLRDLYVHHNWLDLQYSGLTEALCLLCLMSLCISRISSPKALCLYTLLLMIFFISIVVPPPEVTCTFNPGETWVLNYGDNVTFTCTVTSLTQPTITWSTNATTGITTQPDVLTAFQGNDTYTSTLTLNGVTLDNIGRYIFNATNEGGSVATNAMLYVFGKDLIMLIYISYILYILHSCAFLKILFLVIVVAYVRSMMYMYSILEKCNALRSGWGQISGGS